VAQNVFGPISEDVEGFAVTPEEFMAAGDTVAVVVSYTGTGKITGKPLDLPVVHVWEIQDGKAVRFRQFADTVKFADVVPAADQWPGRLRSRRHLAKHERRRVTNSDSLQVLVA
jgi:ketosteroid isomerase-like protein